MTLAEIKPIPDKDTIERLEEMLEDAKKGNLQAFAGVCLWNDERTSNTWSLNKPFKDARLQVVLGELLKLQTLMVLNDEMLLGPIEQLRDEG